jgi:PAS domain S-box-containing protein
LIRQAISQWFHPEIHCPPLPRNGSNPFQPDQELLIPVARADGQELENRYFHVVYQARRDEHGRVNGVINFAVEVTEQVLARKAIEESEARCRSLAENSPDVITRHGKDYRYLYASPRIEGETGIKAGAFIGKSYREVGLPEALCTLLDEHLTHVFAHQTLHTLEYSVPEGKGYVLSRMVPECNQAGEVVSVLVLSTDISERKRAEAALRESEARFRLTADAVPQIVWITDPDGHTGVLQQAVPLYRSAF